MAAKSDLVNRFAFGSNHIAPGSGEYDFFYGIPQDLKRANLLGEQIVAGQRQALSTIQSNHAESLVVLNEIGYSINELNSTVERGFSRIEDSISCLENAVCAELSEIKCVLSQLDDKFGTLIHLARFPRETEAAELVEDGLKALKTSNYEDAEYLFREALGRKRTSFQAHMNLAFVLIHKGIADEAIRHFRKSADYAPNYNEIDILALENLARAHFAAKDFTAAAQVMGQALDLREQRHKRDLNSVYRQTTYAANVDDATGPRLASTLRSIISLCKQDARFFALAATDNDFVGIRPQLLLTLEKLGREEYTRARERLVKAQKELDKLSVDLGNAVQSEIIRVRDVLPRIKGLITKQDYSHSILANKILSRMESLFDPLRELADLRAALPSLRVQLEQNSAATVENFAAMSGAEEALVRGKRLRKFYDRDDSEGLRGFVEYWSAAGGCIGILFVIVSVIAMLMKEVPLSENHIAKFIPLWFAPFLALMIWNILVSTYQASTKTAAEQIRERAQRGYLDLKNTAQQVSLELGNTENRCQEIVMMTCELEAMSNA